MIIIKHIDFIETNKTRCEIISNKPQPLFVKDNEGPKTIDSAEIEMELIVGRRFKRPSDGTDMYIGVSRQAQDIIGIQYEAWENLQREYDYYFNEHLELLRIIEKIKNASFLVRLKWLFKGISI